MWPCPFWCNFCISVEVIRVLEKYQLISAVMVRFIFPVLVLSCSGILIGIDSPLSGLVLPVQDLLGRLGPFHPDLDSSCIERGLASFHSMCKEERGVLGRPEEEMLCENIIGAR